MLKIVFRCDSTPEVGLGHLIRCTAISKELKNHNTVIFATTPDKTNSMIINESIDIYLKEKNETEENFLIRLNKDLKPDIIVLDKKYPYNSDLIIDLKSFGTKIVIMDHLCEGLSSADEIIFPNAHLDKNLLKEYLSPEKIENIKTGPEYVIIRNEILKLKGKMTNQIHEPPVVLVTTGGSDPEGVLIKILPWLEDINLNVNFLILVGESFIFKNQLELMANNLPENFKIIPYSESELINADIAICTFGVSIYEMIFLQIPIICISHNKENSFAASKLKEDYGLIEDIGNIQSLKKEELIFVLKKSINKLKDTQYDKINDLIDGNGTFSISKIIR